MSFFLLSNFKIFLLFLSSIILSILYLPLGLLTLVLLILSLFILRKKNFLRASLEQWSSKIILSPISGKVIKIKKDDQLEVFIKVGLFSGWGLYLPIKSRILNFRRKTKKREELPFILKKDLKSLDKTSSTQMEFESHQFYYHLHFWDRNSFSDTVLNIDTGDIGVSGACLGLFFGGGIVKMILPPDFKVLVDEGMQIKAVKTLIAKL